MNRDIRVQGRPRKDFVPLTVSAPRVLSRTGELRFKESDVSSSRQSCRVERQRRIRRVLGVALASFVEVFLIQGPFRMPRL